jgi:hypothetical protein
MTQGKSAPDLLIRTEGGYLRKIILLLVTVISGAPPLLEVALAEDLPADKRVTEGGMTTVGIRNEVLGLKPAVGMMNFQDQAGGVGNRGVMGFTLDMNAVTTALDWAGDMKSSATKDYYVGLSTGLFYSHLGQAGSGFWGTNSTTGIGNAGSNMFLIPLDLKLGLYLGEFRGSVHGGGNVIYRSYMSAMQIGSASAITTGSSWTIFPNVGVDLEYGVSKAIVLILRPDVSLGSVGEVWLATFGVAIPFG